MDDRPTALEFREKFNRIEPNLGNLYRDLGTQDREDWAKSLYLLLRDDPSNKRGVSLNKDRKACLTLLYEFVDTFTVLQDSKLEQHYVQAIEGSRIQKILDICVIMDRSQSLHKMRVPTSNCIGMHWFSKLHLTSDTKYAKEYPEEQRALVWLLESSDYKGSATMNKRLFQLVHHPAFKVKSDSDLGRWCRPALATFVILSVPREPRPILQSIPPTEQESKSSNDSEEHVILRFVSEYDSPAYQALLEQLYHDLGSQDPEEWAMELYKILEGDPNNARALALNNARKKILDLLYRLVDEWGTNSFSLEFEMSIKRLFKTRRILRIVGVGLIMDRCQSLFKMVLLGSCKVGMHWYCKLHFESAQSDLSQKEIEYWRDLLSGYSGGGTMNKRMFRLLYSPELGLRENALIARWSKPQAAPALVK